jgi:hypothetical protein
MLQGFGETGDVWAPAAAVLVEDHTVLVPTFEAWACGHILKADTTRRRRPMISRR